jgi:hypothetical protein
VIFAGANQQFPCPASFQLGQALVFSHPSVNFGKSNVSVQVSRPAFPMSRSPRVPGQYPQFDLACCEFWRRGQIATAQSQTCPDPSRGQHSALQHLERDAIGFLRDSSFILRLSLTLGGRLFLLGTALHWATGRIVAASFSRFRPPSPAAEAEPAASLHKLEPAPLRARVSADPQ